MRKPHAYKNRRRKAYKNERARAAYMRRNRHFVSDSKANISTSRRRKTKGKKFHSPRAQHLHEIPDSVHSLSRWHHWTVLHFHFSIGLQFPRNAHIYFELFRNSMHFYIIIITTLLRLFTRHLKSDLYWTNIRKITR